ncbi:MAG: AMP-binding protein [Burkholderiaceae bacterium]|nr:AMP-binding protein [Burkholderiaceae bacterium]
MNPLRDGPTTAAMALAALARYGERVAFSGHGGSFTYRQAHDIVGRMQAAMTRLGLRRGDAMAVLHANRGDAWMAGIAASALGLRLTPLHPLGSLADHRFVLEDAGIDHLLVDAHAFAKRGGEIAQSAGLRQVLTLGAAPYGVDLMRAAEAAGSASPVDVSRPDDIGQINYTGGTTGRAKGAYRVNRVLAAANLAVQVAYEWPRAPVYLAVAPNSHAGGTKVLPTLIRGGRVHCMHGFDPERVLDAIARERVSLGFLVPTMIYTLLDAPALARTDLSSLELLIYAASPMSPARLAEGLERIGPVFSQGYGQTETYPITVLARDDHSRADPGLLASCGRPIPAANVALLGDDGKPVAPGEVGEICVRAAHVMNGYWKRDDETAAALAGDWLHTSDMARADDRGFLYIVDRKKDMIISGGFNVYPKEVEDVLSADPTVAMAAVIGVPDAKWGEAVKAFVVPRPGCRPDADALIARVKAQKGGAHAPKSIEMVATIPTTALGKPDKKALRAPYWDRSGRNVG